MVNGNKYLVEQHLPLTQHLNYTPTCSRNNSININQKERKEERKNISKQHNFFCFRRKRILQSDNQKERGKRNGKHMDVCEKPLSARWQVELEVKER